MVRFRLKKVSEAALEPSAVSDAQAMLELASAPDEPRQIASDADLGTAQETLHQIEAWAAADPVRWKRLHEALLRMYAPVRERVDSRDILVAWSAAWLALTHAKRELARLEGLRHLLTERERAVKEGRQADVSFWGRLASHLQVQVPTALVEDIQAVNALLSYVDQQQGVSE